MENQNDSDLDFAGDPDFAGTKSDCVVFVRQNASVDELFAGPFAGCEEAEEDHDFQLPKKELRSFLIHMYRAGSTPTVAP